MFIILISPQNNMYILLHNEMTFNRSDYWRILQSCIGSFLCIVLMCYLTAIYTTIFNNTLLSVTMLNTQSSGFLEILIESIKEMLPKSNPFDKDTMTLIDILNIWNKEYVFEVRCVDSLKGSTRTFCFYQLYLFFLYRHKRW